MGAGGMRVSVKADDPGNLTYGLLIGEGKTVHVFLDEVEQRDVITAEEEEGTVERFVLDSDRHAQIDPNKPGEAWVETVTGNVRIEARVG